MSWTKYQAFIAVVLVITGSINTLSTNWADRMEAVGSDGKEPRKFEHPFVQACSMFIGEMLCLLAFKCLFFYFWRKQGSSTTTMILTFILLIAIPHFSVTFVVDVRCDKETCEDYRNQFPCKELPEDCKPNATGHINGVKLPFPGQCNCCDYCLTYYVKEDDCVSDGRITAPSAICGPGLTCDESTTKCIELETDCIRCQKNYTAARENGSLHFTQEYPQCDEKGEFSPSHCIRGSTDGLLQNYTSYLSNTKVLLRARGFHCFIWNGHCYRCYCVSPKGERIFGERVYSSPDVQSRMKCECSRAAWKAEKAFGKRNSFSFARCLEDGSYDPLQCVGLRCWCLNKKDSVIDTTQTAVLVTNIRDGVPSCFDPNRHQPQQYKTECEEIRDTFTTMVENLWSEHIVPVGMPVQCQYDGYYEKVLITETEKRCVDKNGKDLGYAVSRNDSLADGMDCNCARTRLLLSQAHHSELPECCKNGNFRKLQCRQGRCYCVDHNGDQTVKECDEKDLNSLPCTPDLCAAA